MVLRISFMMLCILSTHSFPFMRDVDKDNNKSSETSSNSCLVLLEMNSEMISKTRSLFSSSLQSRLDR